MKNNIEIFFDKTFKFADIHLDYVKSQLNDFEGSSLYFIMSLPKLRIIDIKFEDGLIVILYKDFVLNKIKEIRNIAFFNFDICYKYIDINIDTTGTYIEFGLTKDGLNYLRYNQPLIFQQYDFSTQAKFSIYDLVALSKSTKDSVCKYDILYIGKSSQIGNRLLNHEHILKIYRDFNATHNNREVIVLLLHPKAKLLQQITLAEMNTSIVLGTSEWENNSLLTTSCIGQNELLDIAEALFIRIFQPHYNSVYKNNNANSKQKTYTKLLNEGVDKITLTLNLFFESTKEVMHIKSNSFDTEKYKAILFDCFISDLFEKDNAPINVDKVEDTRFNFLYE